MDQDLVAIMAQARELLSEVRAATKDLRQAQRDAESYIKGRINEEVEDFLRVEIRKQIESLGRFTEEAMRQSVSKVSQEFKRIERIFLGLERGDNVPSLEEIAKMAQVYRANGVPFIEFLRDPRS